MKNLANGMKVVWFWIRYIQIDSIFEHDGKIINYGIIIDIE